MASVVMSGRGTITLPRALRVALRLHGGDHVEFVETEHGWMVRAPARSHGARAHEGDRPAEAQPAAPVVVVAPAPLEPAVDAWPDYEVLPTVMVVDDSLTVRKVAQRLLEREGYQVVLATDGVDALKQLQAVTPHVLLVDVEMPRMDGFEFSRAVRASAALRQVPIIIVSSYTDAEHRTTARDIGVNEYVGKPYESAELVAHVRHFMARALHRTAAQAR